MFNFKITKDYGSEQAPEKWGGISADNAPFILLTLLVFLLPIFYLPLGVASLLTSKMFLIHIFVLIALFVLVLLKLREQTFKLPINLMTLSIVLIPFITLLAAIFSKNPGLSMSGRDFGVDTLMSTIILFVLLFTSIILFKTKKGYAYVYVLTIFSFLLVFLLHILNVLIPAFPTLGVFTENISTTLGKWNDLAIFATVISFITLITPQLLRLEKNAKIWNYVSLGAALVFLILVNFSFAWYSLAIFTLVSFVYLIVVHQRSTGKSFIPIVPLVIFLISFLFIIAGNNIGDTLSAALNINNFEVRPSWSATFEVIKGTISHRPILGSGPGLFESEWLLYRPGTINLTDFWDLDFRYGVGMIPSYVVTTGILGGLSWAFFFILILYYGFKGLFKKPENIINHYFLVSSFIVTIYLWATMVFYLPSASIIALTFVFTGIFISSLYKAGVLEYKELSIDREPKYGFIYITVLVLILIGIIAMAYSITNKFVAHLYFSSATNSLNIEGNLDKAEQEVTQALRLDRNDTYLRSLAEIGSVRINRILNDSKTPQDLLVDQFRTTLAGTVSSYQEAIGYDKNNYNNYQDLGTLYQALVTLRVEGAYAQSRSFLDQAVALNPKSPGLKLQLARLEVANNNLEGAKKFIQESLELKQNYTDAIFLLSQIQVTEGNTEQAIKTVEAATVIRPNDPLVYFQLGMLRYSSGQFGRAVPAFERAVILNPSFQNAKYFLGLSYYESGRKNDAVTQFTDLKNLNPGNSEVELILKNISAGLDAFSGAKPPIDSTPEGRVEPPLEDENADVNN